MPGEYFGAEPRFPWTLLTSPNAGPPLLYVQALVRPGCRCAQVLGIAITGDAREFRGQDRNYLALLALRPPGRVQLPVGRRLARGRLGCRRLGCGPRCWCAKWHTDRFPEGAAAGHTPRSAVGLSSWRVTVERSLSTSSRITSRPLRHPATLRWHGLRARPSTQSSRPRPWRRSSRPAMALANVCLCARRSGLPNELRRSPSPIASDFRRWSFGPERITRRCTAPRPCPRTWPQSISLVRSRTVSRCRSCADGQSCCAFAIAERSRVRAGRRRPSSSSKTGSPPREIARARSKVGRCSLGARGVCAGGPDAEISPPPNETRNAQSQLPRPSTLPSCWRPRSWDSVGSSPRRDSAKPAPWANV